jgi:hypothetical protein
MLIPAGLPPSCRAAAECRARWWTRGHTIRTTPPARPRYLRVEVHQEGDEEGPVLVNVRVPIQLLRAGVKLASVIPPQAQEHVNEALRERGVPFDLSRLRPEDLDELIEQLQDLTIDVDQQGDKEKVKVRVFCE